MYRKVPGSQQSCSLSMQRVLQAGFKTGLLQLLSCSAGPGCICLSVRKEAHCAKSERYFYNQQDCRFVLL